MPIASPAVVADTHTLIWFLINPARLSAAALAALQAAEATGEPIYVATITLVELRYLVEIGLPLVTADTEIRKLSNITTIW